MLVFLLQLYVLYKDVVVGLGVYVLLITVSKLNQEKQMNRFKDEYVFMTYTASQQLLLSRR